VVVKRISFIVDLPSGFLDYHYLILLKQIEQQLSKYQKLISKLFELTNNKELYLVGGTIRDIYLDREPFDFDFALVPYDPPDEIFLTDTTFRDGQQSRPPYTPSQIADLFEFLVGLALELVLEEVLHDVAAQEAVALNHERVHALARRGDGGGDPRSNDDARQGESAVTYDAPKAQVFTL
jgi:hypothetical protein